MNIWVVSSLAIVNNTTMNSHVHISKWTLVLSSLGRLPRSGIVASHCNSVFDLRHCQIVFLVLSTLY